MDGPQMKDLEGKSWNRLMRNGKNWCWESGVQPVLVQAAETLVRFSFESEFARKVLARLWKWSLSFCLDKYYARSPQKLNREVLKFNNSRNISSEQFQSQVCEIYVVETES